MRIRSLYEIIVAVATARSLSNYFITAPSAKRGRSLRLPVPVSLATGIVPAEGRLPFCFSGDDIILLQRLKACGEYRAWVYLNCFLICKSVLHLL